MTTRRPKRDSSRVRLQPADASIWIALARSQRDPRKAFAELVQNAIDANAGAIVIERCRRGRVGPDRVANFCHATADPAGSGQTATDGGSS